jgi:YD repeat-containing protein
MPIELNDPNAQTERAPVLKHRRIGETFAGMLLDVPQQRDRLKKNPATQELEPIPNGRGGNRKELVVRLLYVAGDMTAGSEMEPVHPQPGDEVRIILKGKGYGEWIDADKALQGRQVGDVVTISTTHGQTYDANGNPTGQTLTTQGEVDSVPRGITVGLYGPVGIRRALPEEAAWVAKAEEIHMASKAIALDSGIAPQAAPAVDVSGVFGGAALPPPAA